MINSFGTRCACIKGNMPFRRKNIRFVTALDLIKSLKQIK